MGEVILELYFNFKEQIKLKEEKYFSKTIIQV